MEDERRVYCNYAPEDFAEAELDMAMGPDRRIKLVIKEGSMRRCAYFSVQKAKDMAKYLRQLIHIVEKQGR